MSRSVKSFLNFLFIAASAAGGLAIFYSDKLPENAVLLVPVLSVFVFAFAAGLAQRNTLDDTAAEHYSELIYFMGFLFTLVSLAALFYQLGSGGLGAETTGQEKDISETLTLSRKMELSTGIIEKTFRYIGVAVTTSISGVLLRNIVRSKYIKNHVSETPSKDNIDTALSESVKALNSYFKERDELDKKIREKELGYIQALDTFSSTIVSFSENLSKTGRELSGSSEDLSKSIKNQTEILNQNESRLKQFSESLDLIRRQLQGLPLEDTAGRISELGNETGQFNAILDSMIEIVERKIEIAGKAG